MHLDNTEYYSKKMGYNSNFKNELIKKNFRVVTVLTKKNASVPSPMTRTMSNLSSLTLHFFYR